MWQAGVNPIGYITGFSWKWKNGKDISPHAHSVHNDLRIQQLFCTLGLLCVCVCVCSCLHLSMLNEYAMYSTQGYLDGMSM